MYEPGLRLRLLCPFVLPAPRLGFGYYEYYGTGRRQFDVETFQIVAHLSLHYAWVSLANGFAIHGRIESLSPK